MQNRKIFAAVAAAVLMMSLVLCGCGGKKTQIPTSFRDGTYSGRSSDFDEDETGNGSGYGEVEITIENGKISACTFTMYELDGTLKDESYGADLSKENRLKAQKAVQSAEKYAQMLVEAGSLDGVDAITGATISYNEFIEAVTDALVKAGE